MACLCVYSRIWLYWLQIPMGHFGAFVIICRASFDCVQRCMCVYIFIWTTSYACCRARCPRMNIYMWLITHCVFDYAWNCSAKYFHLIEIVVHFFSFCKLYCTASCWIIACVSFNFRSGKQLFQQNNFHF